MFPHSRILSLALLAWTGSAQTMPHAGVLFTADSLAHLKARIQTQPWAAQWKAAQTAFDSTLAQPVDLPPRGGNWWHWYVCPRHGQRLTTGQRVGPWQWEHICPVDHEIFRGDPSRPDRDFDGVVISSWHDRYAHAVQTAGILYAVTGDERYAARGREILSAYAARYLSYPLHDTKGQAKIGGGRVHPQTLDESIWLIPIAQGADLLWDYIPPADRQKIVDRLLLPAARDVILPHHLGIHNIQNWKNSAVGVVGFLLGDQSLIHAAIDDPDRGYRVQMAKGVQPDGVWFEGAWGYHYYTMNAVWALTEAARNAGIDLYGEPLKKMFEAPMKLAMPNLMLPNFNDSEPVKVQDDLYELAYARYRDPLDLAGLAGTDRRNNFALWFGVDELPKESAPALGSRNAPDSGYAILQRGEGEAATWLCLKYGPHGGGHGHFDKDSFILYSRGDVQFPDPGRRPYGSPLHAEWDRVTVAHNTLVVDQASQAPATGKSLAFGSDHNVDYAMIDAGNIYPGVRFIRTAALLNENLIVFIDRVTAPRPHMLDIAVHDAGEWRKKSAGEEIALGDKDGYQHLKDIAAARSTKPAPLQFAGPDGACTAVTLAGGPPTQVITATGVGKSTEDRVPMILFRRTARETTYVWAVSLNCTPVSMTVKPQSPGRLAVELTSAANSWSLAVDTDAATVQASFGARNMPQ